jgi:integrase
MPITKEKGRFRFHFKRIVGNRRIRASKLLPKGWTEKQAYEFDQKETARLYALATGQQQEPLIEDAVLLYIKHRLPELESGKEVERQLEADFPLYQGLTFDDLPEVVALINKSKQKPRTKQARISYIRAACRYAFKFHRMGSKLPGVGLAIPTVKNERHEYYTRAEVVRMARNCRRSSRPYLLIAFYSGMRLSEQFKAQVIDGRFVLKTTKNKNPKIIPIHPKIQRIAEKCLPPRVAYSTIQDHQREARKKAKITGKTFHDLRHSAASEMINNDVDLYTVGAVLGHRDARSTARYAHLATNTLKAAVDKIGRKRPDAKTKDAA